MDGLSDLVSCCRSLDTDKAAERKKATDKFTQLLNKNSVIKCLDRNSDEKAKGHKGTGGRFFTWDDVFKVVCNFVEVETTALRKAKDSQSVTTQANRQKKKQEVSSLFKHVVKQANKRGPRLKCHHVISHAMLIMQDDYTCSAYGLDYSSTLLKCILSVRKYWTDIPQNTWHELLSLYCKLYQDPVNTVDRVVLARIIHMLVHGASVQCDIRPKRLLNFFTQIIKNVRQEKITQVLEYIVAAMNVFVATISPDSRTQICRLGESVFLGILWLWDNRPSEVLKGELVLFIKRQVEAHHPGGAKTTEKGAFAIDWDLWMSHLRKVYEALYMDLKQMGGRNKFSSGTKECVLKDEYVELVADICQQLFSQTASVIEITQISTAGGQSGSKKRRLESGWGAFRDIITDTGQNAQVIPWLQLISRLVEKYPESIPEEELAPYLHCFLHLLTECRRGEVIKFVLHCAKIWADGYSCFTHMSAAILTSAKATWQKMWALALRFVSLHQSQRECFQLLRSIMCNGLVTPQRELWNLFLPNICQSNDAAVQFLYSYLQLHDLPENYQPNLPGVSSGATRGSYPLRKQLLNWLLPANEEEFESSTVKSMENRNCCLLAKTLLALTLKSPQLFSGDKSSSMAVLSEMESLYLESMFLIPMKETEESVSGKNLSHLHIPLVLKHLEDCFANVSQSLMKIIEPQVAALTIMASHCCMIVEFLQLSVQHEVLDLAQLTKLNTFDCLKQMFKIICMKICDFIHHKDGLGQLSELFKVLQTILAWDSVDVSTFAIAEICRTITPARFIDLLLDVAFDKIPRSTSTSRRLDESLDSSRLGGSRRGHKSRRMEVIDDFDMDFEDGASSRQECDIDMDFNDASESQESDETANRSEVCVGLLSPSILTESQRMRLDVVRVLCLWTSYDKTLCSVELPITSDINLAFIKTTILKLLDEDTFDPNRGVDLQIMLVIITSLMSASHHVLDSDLEAVLEALKQVARVHRRDQDISSVCLDLLALIVPHLSKEEDLPTVIMSECRDVALHLFTAFWRVQDDGQFNCKTRLAIAGCLHTFIQCDPLGKWTELKPPTNRSDSSSSETDFAMTGNFPQCLGDYSHQLRMFTSTNLHSLFCICCDGRTTPLNKVIQNDIFDKIYDVLHDSLTLDGKLSPDRQQDEVTNRTASLLRALATILCSSPVCEKKALFAFCQLIKESNIQTQTVAKVLNQVSGYLHYGSLTEFMSSHLPFLIHQWLELKYEMPLFPYQLLSCSTTDEFFRSHLSVIVPHLVMHKDFKTIESIGKQLHVDWRGLLRECVPQILVHILPWFAANKMGGPSLSEGNVKRKVAHASSCYDLLTKEITNEAIDKSSVANLDEIVVNILMCLYDPDDEQFSAACERESDPAPNPPYFNSHFITATLDYLTQSFSGNVKTLVSVLAKTQDSIQKILLSLSIHFTKASKLPEKRRILHMYHLFVSLLLTEFGDQLGGSWAFVLRDVINRLLCIIRSISPNLTSAVGYNVDCILLCVNLLENVCTVAIDLCPEPSGSFQVMSILSPEENPITRETCPRQPVMDNLDGLLTKNFPAEDLRPLLLDIAVKRELAKYLSWIVISLTPLSEDITDIGKKAKDLLQFLVVDNTPALKSAIASLDPFPETPTYQDLKTVHTRLKYAAGAFSLRQEIEHFLKIGEQHWSGSESRLEGLQFLLRQLQSRPVDLNDLVQDCEDTQSSSLLCRLVCALIHFCRDSSSVNSQAAARCLGEIGPVNLCTVRLPHKVSVPDQLESLEEFNDSPQKQKYCHIFYLLNEYLINQSVSLVSSSSSVIRQMLATKTGASFMTEYKHRLEDKDFLFQYLHPFKCNKKKVTSLPENTPDLQLFKVIVNESNLWTPAHNRHEDWIRDLTCALIQCGAVRDELLRLIQPICQLKTKFCEEILPYLLHAILLPENGDYKDILSVQVSHFFTAHCVQREQMDSQRSTPFGIVDKSTICMNKDSIRTMLDAIQYLRQQQRPKEGHRPLTSWDNNFWLDVNYLHIAKAAQYCCAHFTTVLYAEIWCDTQSSDQDVAMRDFRSQILSPFEAMNPSSSDVTPSLNVKTLLLEVSSAIGDPDASYGYGAGTLTDVSTRLRTYEHENQWDKALMMYDIELSQTGCPQLGMLQSLQNFGASNLLDKYMESQEMSPDIQEFRYEAAWRTSQWKMEVPSRLTSDCSFHQAMYSSLDAMKDQHLTCVEPAMDMARLSAIRLLGEDSLESSRSIYPVLSRLHCVMQIQDTLQHAIRNKDSQSLLTKWDAQRLCVSADYEFLEPVLTLRTVLLSLLSEDTDGSVYKGQITQLQNCARLAREAGRLQIAEKAIHQLKVLNPSEKELLLPCQIEEAKLYWASGESKMAKHLVRTLINTTKQVYKDSRVLARLYCQVLSLYGNWLAETRSENPNVIMEKYLEKTVHLLETIDSQQADDTALDAYLSLGRFADTQYQSIVNYMSSNTYEAKQALMRKAKADVERLKHVVDRKDRYLRTLEKQTEIDEAELSRQENDKSKFLLIAVENYIRCLQYGDKHDLRVFRLTSLWFCNAAMKPVNKMIQASLSKIPSYKFLPLMYQLAARMSMKDQHCSLFQPTLDKIIEGAAVDHPHHTLSIILALAHANKDDDILQTVKVKKGRLSSRSNSDESNSEQDRVLAAKAMIERLKKSSVGKIVGDMEKLSIAYIQLANFNVDQYKRETRPINLPSTLTISQMKNLSNVAVPTADIKVDPTGKYGNIEYVMGFEAKFKLAGGINLPKIITCISSTGRWTKQLVKGKDDLRQDAVMQQVFEMVNHLLRKENETRKRRLTIRRYKVIPLSQRSGLLEWCEGTQPLGEYLIGSPSVKGAHSRYRQGDWTALECRNAMTTVHADPDCNKKYLAYANACQHFQPVFRHFFMEKFSNPANWYERRHAYIKSVATNSIVGYILGLGDRHVQNVLIDCNTAELVHIDFGVAFEQGKILPTPETVPFRLTRDIVDGMGVAGVEGVFRRCCEVVMSVMHQNQEPLLTLLQVLLYDPLYIWTISPQKAYTLQHRRDPDTSDLNSTTGEMDDVTDGLPGSGDSRSNVNKMAERVLLRLQQKLQGSEDGVQLSCGGQVTHLIQEARDPKNLCRLFPGWQPYI